MKDLSLYLAANQITQGEFATRLGVSRTYLNEIVRGRKLPTLRLAFEIQAQTREAVLARSWVDAEKEVVSE